MPTLSQSPLRRATCAAVLLTQLAGCQTWRPLPGSIDQQVGAGLSHARLTLRDGSELALRDVTVHADSVIGYSEDTGVRRARSVADVVSIQQRQTSGMRTTGVVLLAGTVALAALVVAALVALTPNWNAAPSPAASAH